jgi:hypothetical protein
MIPAPFHAALLLAATQTLAHANSDDAHWPVAGQQGLMRFVIVPVDLARDRPAYLKQIERLCEPDSSCFLNFYTNTSAAPLAVPLPDAIDREATAVFRRSSKQGVSSFRWSCRLQMPDTNCF